MTQEEMEALAQLMAETINEKIQKELAIYCAKCRKRKKSKRKKRK